MKLDYSWMATATFKISPTVAICNVANTRQAVRVLQQGTDAGGNPDLR